MPGTSTIYDVKVRYALEDKASKGLTGVASAADKAGESVFSLKHAIEALALKEVFHLGKEALIDFNSEIDQMKIGMTTVMQMNLHMPFEKANKEADKLFETFQALAKKSPLTTKDFMEMATAISPAIAMAGGGPEKLAKITSGALTAGLAYGQRSDIVAMDVQEMLMGNVTKRNRLGNELLGSIGMKGEDFNKKDQSERASLVEKMFDQEGLKKAADRFGQTFKGQISTLQDNLQIALGQVGRPLMEAMTAEVAKWNAWIEKHPKLIAETVHELGDMISTAFGFVKNTSQWLIEHKDLIFSLGKLFLVFKGAQIGANAFKRFSDGIEGLAKKVEKTGEALQNSLGADTGIGGAFGKLSSVLGTAAKGAGVIGQLVMFGGALYTAVGAVDTFVQDMIHGEADRKAKGAQRDLHEAVQDIPDLLKRRGMLQTELAGKGMVPLSDEMKDRFSNEVSSINDKLLNPQHMGEIIRKISEESASHGGASFSGLTVADMQKANRLIPDMFDYTDANKSKQITEEVLQTLKLFNDQTFDQRREIMKYAFPEQFGKPADTNPAVPEAPWGAGSKPEVNITIQKIEVASEDPDRFVFGIVKMGEQATKHPTASQHSIPGGF